MGKSIFLLADGTGNAAASPFKTNIWRLYQAVDQTGFDQIAFYTDGVGTETFKPLRALGAAFGIGLARNVKHAYQFLCRNYDDGDRIFLFGFSRGAFTVRILAGLILRCGIIVKAPNEHLLTDYVEHAYSEYKRDAAKRATATRATRWNIYGLWLRLLDSNQRKWKKARLLPRILWWKRWQTGRLLPDSWQTDRSDHRVWFPRIRTQIFPKIDFIGVWDTVDAYGMPIDELKVAIDKWLCPMTLADRKFPDEVRRACHALSLDDERPTFRPVLWTDPIVEPERLMQVWFAGVHANVGGGYPDDGLAYVTLQWIMREAVLVGARFLPDHMAQVDARCDAHGRQYDSRAGLAGYYRYGPRNVDDLCNDPEHGVQVAIPVVHAAAWARMSGRRVAYAPTSFPTRYLLAKSPTSDTPPQPNIEAQRKILSLMGNPMWVGEISVEQHLSTLEEVVLAERLGISFVHIYPDDLGTESGGRLSRPEETHQEIEGRNKEMRTVRSAIWRRRFAYFATVYSSAILALLPVFDGIRGLSFWQSIIGARMSWLLSPIIDGIRDLSFWQSIIGAWTSWLLSMLSPDHWLAPVLNLAVKERFGPGWAAPWLTSFANHPTLFVLSATLLLWLFLRKSQLLQTRIFHLAQYAWRHA